ncbi:unnamed protein product [Calicophoron daubneyi]|uniref:Uncharacterized protein n=1 Tax=Calicophoron daubneyi TaxID=300641 RepID=A0AAV2TAE3_CALDB
MLTSCHNQNQTRGMQKPPRESRIQWTKGTVINSGLGRKKYDSCDEYPDEDEVELASLSSSDDDSKEPPEPNNQSHFWRVRRSGAEQQEDGGKGISENVLKRFNNVILLQSSDSKVKQDVTKKKNQTKTSKNTEISKQPENG